MKTEYEVKVLEVNHDEMVKKLEAMGALLVGEFNQKRYVYDLIPKEEDRWIRLRTNGDKTTLTIKQIKKQSIDGTKELEIVVDDFETTHNILLSLGFREKGYQENRRIQYKLDGVEIDFDSWPMVPEYVEIEGNSEEEVISILNKLGIDLENVCTLSVKSVYEKYGLDIDEYPILKF